MNPVRAGLVEEHWHYLYSRARAYCDMDCFLGIDYL